jgi:hypothetical protein
MTETPVSSESSISGRESLYDDEKTPKMPEESEWRGIMRYYRRDPPLVLTDDQRLDQYQSIRRLECRENMHIWQH